MTPAESTSLWQGLADMRIEPAGADITFAAKLARENGWTREFAAAVMEEYRRFLYLAATAPHPVSPSPAVDEAWHLHLTYSRHYWDVLCGRILQRPLHHDPSLGGAAEDARHRDQYARTLALYRDAFGAEPPASVWPGAAPVPVRSGKAARVAAAASATTLLAACTALSGVADPDGDNNLLGFIIIGAVLLLIVYLVVRVSRRGGGRHGGRRAGASGGVYGASDSGSDWNDKDWSDSGSDGGSSCGGGCGGGGD